MSQTRVVSMIGIAGCVMATHGLGWYQRIGILLAVSAAFALFTRSLDR